MYGEINKLRLIEEYDGEYGRNFAKLLTSFGSEMEAELTHKTLSH
jgi:hypothetical protein